VKTGTAIAIGAAALLGVGLLVALTSSAKAAPSLPPAPAGGGARCQPGQTGNLVVTHLPDSGSTVQLRAGDTLRTSLLVQPGYDWTVTASNSVLSMTKATTGPDPSNPHGTDRVLIWQPQQAGTTVLTGQLLPKGGGPAAASFTLNVQVSC
jgi:hypothetical protein